MYTVYYNDHCQRFSTVFRQTIRTSIFNVTGGQRFSLKTQKIKSKQVKIFQPHIIEGVYH